MKLTVLGCGDAFGSGGRLQTSYLVHTGGRAILLDCGATVMTGLHRANADTNTIDTVVISHLHGDHFAGLVWFLLHARHVAKRSAPLTIVGPAGLEARLQLANEALYAGSTEKPYSFHLNYVDLDTTKPIDVDGLSIEAFEVCHPSGALSAAVRLRHDGKTLAFSGDTQWTDTLIPCAADADLFICECYAMAPGVSYHLNYATLTEKLPQLTARHILLTHMAPNMLQAAAAGALGDVDQRVRFAEDGMTIDVG